MLDDGERVASVGFDGAVASALERRLDLDVLAIVDPDDSTTERRARGRAGLVEPWQLADLGTTHLLIGVRAASPTTALVPAEARDAVFEARGARVWLVLDAGRLLPQRLFDAVATANAADPALTTIDTAMAAIVVGPNAVDTAADLVGRVDCPLANELLRPF